ncbi:hypothetical protein [Jeotgalibacillus proteolyticus]|uniref:DUF2953 domain-containing protein n=1 Tax=Jeotgalibacillus proteolyticus TaxID=2082395 RepID=A0A2S5GF13_9BACL|nr:hypothetical protein [Jeotgalibacillus proteolyticus]PPA71642.1 hypothetical protein C4B60_06180 [Jeotgalibacillus proteolyticus]
MWVLAVIGAFICSVLFYIYFSKITVSISFRKTGHNDRVEITVKLFNGLINKELMVPLIKKEGLGLSYNTSDMKTSKSENKTFTSDDAGHLQVRYQKFLKTYHDAKIHLNRLWSGIRIEQLTTDIRLGTGQADMTAYSSSLIWMLQSFLRTFLAKKVSINCRPVHKVVPLYGFKAFKMTATCIASIRFGHLMKIGIRLFLDRRMSKNLKAGEVHGTSY